MIIQIYIIHLYFQMVKNLSKIIISLDYKFISKVSYIMNHNNEFTHNEFTKTEYLSNSDYHSVKVNSRDRNIETEKNPFDFKIKFNKWDRKITNYHVQDWWNTSDPNKISTTIKFNNGATIPDSIENIKDLRISEIVAPRFIPDNQIGKLVENVTVTCVDNFSNSIFFKSDDDTKAEYIFYTIPFYKITDFNQNVYFLFKKSDMTTLSIDIKKTYGLYERYYTDTIYHISDIEDGRIQLDSSINFIETNIYLPKFNVNNIWYDTDSLATSKISHTSNSLTLLESGHLINHNFTKNSIFEINKNHYFKIASVNFTYVFKDTDGNIIKTEYKNYTNNTFTDSEIQTINTGINSTPLVTVTTQFIGTWLNNTYPPIINDGTVNKIIHLKEGMRDLLNDKQFYLSLEPFTPSKNLITNGKLNNVIGTLYPSTQSRNYIYLTGKNVGQRFSHRNLQNIKDLSFKLYHKDGTLVGTNFENYTLNYLEKECRQTMITFSIETVDRSFN